MAPNSRAREHTPESGYCGPQRAVVPMDDCNPSVETGRQRCPTAAIALTGQQVQRFDSRDSVLTAAVLVKLKIIRVLRYSL